MDKDFIEFYMNRYQQPGETNQETVNRVITSKDLGDCEQVWKEWFKKHVKGKGTYKGIPIREHKYNLYRLGYGPQ